MSSPLWEGVREGCGSCAFRKPDERPDWKEHGYCRRYPPQVIVGIRDGNTAGDWSQEWPWMQKDDWCGEWKRK